MITPNKDTSYEWWRIRKKNLLLDLEDMFEMYYELFPYESKDKIKEVLKELSDELESRYKTRWN